MSDKERLTMAGIRLKKKQIEDELEFLEDSFESRLQGVKSNFIKAVNLSEPIKENPVKAVGIAIAAGLIFGLSRPKRKKKKNRVVDPTRIEHVEYEEPELPVLGFRTLLFDEIKRIAARRAALYISEMMDKKIQQ